MKARILPLVLALAPSLAVVGGKIANHRGVVAAVDAVDTAGAIHGGHDQASAATLQASSLRCEDARQRQLQRQQQQHPFDVLLRPERQELQEAGDRRAAGRPARRRQGDAVGLGKPKPKKEVGKKDVEGVFVVAKDNKVTFRPVKVGIAGEKYFEVQSGLKPGEKIVAGTYQAIRELKDGTLVRETKVDPKKPAVKS